MSHSDIERDLATYTYHSAKSCPFKPVLEISRLSFSSGILRTCLVQARWGKESCPDLAVDAVTSLMIKYFY